MRRLALLGGALAAALAGCDRLPGKPSPGQHPLRPSQVMDFATLYGRQCAGCHGSDRRPGAAQALADPVYLALADDATIRRVTAAGVPGTSMPGFARSQGGTLTDAQIDAIVSGIRAHWARRDALGGAAPPPHAAPPGDPSRGVAVYAARCASCHGADGTGGPHGGSVVDGSYLALASDQALRTAVIAGRPALGMPDWRGEGGAPPMTADEVADVVAWMIAQRPPLPGQPYPASAHLEDRTDG